MDAILKRRSIRKFKPDPVSEDLVKGLLRAAMSAPSAGNAQPWHFIVINKKEILARIPDIHPYSRMITQAPLAILVCADTSKEKHPGNFPLDCAAAVENMLLAATDKGLGTVWLGIYPDVQRVERFKDMFTLPEPLVPFAIVPVGYPGEEKAYTDRYNERFVSYNAY